MKRPLCISQHYRFTFNPATNLYDVVEAGITYSLTMEQVRDFSRYYKAYPKVSAGRKPTFAEWYKDLDKQTRKEVRRTGMRSAQSDFFPDQHPLED